MEYTSRLAYLLNPYRFQRRYLMHQLKRLDQLPTKCPWIYPINSEIFCEPYPSSWPSVEPRYRVYGWRRDLEQAIDQAHTRIMLAISEAEASLNIPGTVYGSHKPAKRLRQLLTLHSQQKKCSKAAGGWLVINKELSCSTYTIFI